MEVQRTVNMAEMHRNYQKRDDRMQVLVTRKKVAVGQEDHKDKKTKKEKSDKKDKRDQQPEPQPSAPFVKGGKAGKGDPKQQGEGGNPSGQARCEQTAYPCY